MGAGRVVVFGEITLPCWAGWESFDPVEWDFRLGAMWGWRARHARIPGARQTKMR